MKFNLPYETLKIYISKVFSLCLWFHFSINKWYSSYRYKSKAKHVCLWRPSFMPSFGKCLKCELYGKINVSIFLNIFGSIVNIETDLLGFSTGYLERSERSLSTNISHTDVHAHTTRRGKKMKYSEVQWLATYEILHSCDYALKISVQIIL